MTGLAETTERAQAALEAAVEKARRIVDFTPWSAEDESFFREILPFLLDLASDAQAARAEVERLQNELTDRTDERDSGRKESKHTCIALADEFMSHERSGAHLFGLGWLVGRAVEHHKWHHDAQNVDYVKALEHRADQAEARVRELETRLDGITVGSHTWIPVAECGELADGRWHVLLRSDAGYSEEADIRLLRGEWQTVGKVHSVLSPSLGPIPEGK